MSRLFRRSEDIDAARAAALIKHGATVVDVREPHEWQAGHIPGALHIPLRELATRVDELPHDAMLIAVCRSGGRSARATTSLSKAGYHVENLRGGMKAWAKAGQPLEPPTGHVS